MGPRDAMLNTLKKAAHKARFSNRISAFSPKPPKRIKDAIPLRRGVPEVAFPVDVMLTGLCPKAGAGLLRMRWQTKRHFLVERDWLVDKGLPGEVVRLKFGKVSKKRWPHGAIDVFPDPEVRKVTSSPYEVPPACPHYDICSGCDFLHLSYGRQLIEKQRWVEQAILPTKASSAAIQRIRPSEPQQFYANKVEWIFSEDEGDLRFGPAGYSGRTESLEPLAGCVLPPRAATRVLSVFCEAFMEQRQARPDVYSIYDEKGGVGRFKSVIAVCTRSPGPRSGKAGSRRRTEVLLNIIVAEEVKDVEDVLRPLSDAVAEVAPRCLVGIVVNRARAKRDLMGGRREILLHGRRNLRQEFSVSLPKGIPQAKNGAGVLPALGYQPIRPQGPEKKDFLLQVGAGSRMVAHSRLAGDLAKVVLEFCKVGETDIVWHCFCGAGELSLALSAVGEHVVAIGTSAAEVSTLKRNLAANKVDNATSVLCNLRSPWTLKQLSMHISQSQQKRLLLGTGDEQEKARDFAVTCFVPGEGRRRQLQRLLSAPFTAPLLREDAMAHRELQTLLPAFVRDFRPGATTLPVPQNKEEGAVKQREVTPEMETRLKSLYRKLAFKYHPDQNPDDPEASDRFLALTQAYRALVGDKAGPEEGDDEAVDPFVTAVHSSYRPKFKHRWTREELTKEERDDKRAAFETQRAAAAAAAPSSSAQAMDGEEESAAEMAPPEEKGPFDSEDEDEAKGNRPKQGDTVRILRESRASRYTKGTSGTKGKSGKLQKDERNDLPFKVLLDGGQIGWYHEGDIEICQDKPEYVEEEWEFDEGEDFVVKMEIDEAWASPVEPSEEPSEAAAYMQHPHEPGDNLEEASLESEVQINAEAAAPTKTLPPPDVIVVSQPRNRKAGRGTPSYFHTWLRSTAARAIVYVATDADAFAEDLKAMIDLGYSLEQLQPFDPEPHRRGLLLVARLELVRPLAGSADYLDGAEERLLGGSRGLHLPHDVHNVPLLGTGGYAGSAAAIGR